MNVIPNALLKYAVPGNGGCWLWKRALTKKGYANKRVGNKVRQAHRWVYEMLVGPIPDGLQIDHLCGIRNCVNPDHLRAVSPEENRKRSRRCVECNRMMEPYHVR